MCIITFINKWNICILFDYLCKSYFNSLTQMIFNFLPSFVASSAKMGLVETKLAIIPGGGRTFACPPFSLCPLCPREGHKV